MKNIAIIFMLLFHSIQAFSCTTFVLKDSGKFVFGRNLDWFSDNGLVLVNQRGVKKNSLVFPPEKTTSWTSRYGSVSFNQFGKELPFGGINEKGLVVEVMLVDGDYPEYDERTVVNELQWVQYQLDNSSTVDEVIETDEFIRISKVNQNLHYLVCDRLGQVAVIEFNADGMKVYRGTDLPIPVLENDRYATSLLNYENEEESRFRSAANMISNYIPQKNTMVDYSFEILEEVALDGSWSVVYDMENIQIHFKTKSNRSIRTINIDAFDFNCAGGALMYDLNRDDRKNINTLFIAYNQLFNQKKFDEAIESNGVEFSEETLELFYSYQMTCSCSVH